jgi:hypothetical protein
MAFGAGEHGSILWRLLILRCWCTLVAIAFLFLFVPFGCHFAPMYERTWQALGLASSLNSWKCVHGFFDKN